MKSDLYDVRVKVCNETYAAYLVASTDDPDTRVWVPRSQVEMAPDRDGMQIMTAPGWLLTQKGLL